MAVYISDNDSNLIKVAGSSTTQPSGSSSSSSTEIIYDCSDTEKNWGYPYGLPEVLRDDSGNITQAMTYEYDLSKYKALNVFYRHGSPTSSNPIEQMCSIGTQHIYADLTQPTFEADSGEMVYTKNSSPTYIMFALQEGSGAVPIPTIPLYHFQLHIYENKQSFYIYSCVGDTSYAESVLGATIPVFSCCVTKIEGVY